MSEKNIHSGHRERLMKTIYNGDFYSLSIYQQVEALLFYVIPRVDVNPLAHRLVDKFGSFAAILDADINDLIAVKGMGESSAIKLKNMRFMFNRYNESRYDLRLDLTKGQLYQMYKDILSHRPQEETLLVSVDKANKLNGYRIIARGDSNSVEVELKKILNFVDSCKSWGLYMGHNHPDGNSLPSQADKDSHNRLKEFLANYGCKLGDSFVVSLDGVFSIENKRMVLRAHSNTYLDVIKRIKGA